MEPWTHMFACLFTGRWGVIRPDLLGKNPAVLLITIEDPLILFVIILDGVVLVSRFGVLEGIAAAEFVLVISWRFIVKEIN